MLNKRKALIGWVVYTVAKPIVKRVVKSRASRLVPCSAAGAAGIAAMTVAVLGGAALRRKRRSGNEETGES